MRKKKRNKKRQSELRSEKQGAFNKDRNERAKRKQLLSDQSNVYMQRLVSQGVSKLLPMWEVLVEE